MRVHLTTKVTCDHVDLSLVHEANQLDVVGSLEELETSQGSLGNETSSMARLGAPCNHFAFNFADGLAGFRRSPEAEIYRTQRDE